VARFKGRGSRGGFNERKILCVESGSCGYLELSQKKLKEMKGGLKAGGEQKKEE